MVTLPRNSVRTFKDEVRGNRYLQRKQEWNGERHDRLNRTNARGGIRSAATVMPRQVQAILPR